jgi:hypothetical protein
MRRIADFPFCAGLRPLLRRIVDQLKRSHMLFKAKKRRPLPSISLDEE